MKSSGAAVPTCSFVSPSYSPGTLSSFSLQGPTWPKSLVATYLLWQGPHTDLLRKHLNIPLSPPLCMHLICCKFKAHFMHHLTLHNNHKIDLFAGDREKGEHDTVHPLVQAVHYLTEQRVLHRDTLVITVRKYHNILLMLWHQVENGLMPSTVMFPSYSERCMRLVPELDVNMDFAPSCCHLLRQDIKRIICRQTDVPGWRSSHRAPLPDTTSPLSCRTAPYAEPLVPSTAGGATGGIKWGGKAFCPYS